MTPTQYVQRLRREGYRFWKIAIITGLTENDVAEMLVDSGMYSIETCVLVMAQEKRMKKGTT